MGPPRVWRAITAILRGHLDPVTSVVGLSLKVLVGAVYAVLVGDERLADGIVALAARHGVPPDELDVSARFGTIDATLPPSLAEQREVAILTLARAAAPSPPAVDEHVIEGLRAARIEPEAIVEAVSWVSLLQLLHRLRAGTRRAEPRGRQAASPRVPPHRRSPPRGASDRESAREHTPCPLAISPSG